MKNKNQEIIVDTPCYLGVVVILSAFLLLSNFNASALTTDFGNVTSDTVTTAEAISDSLKEKPSHLNVGFDFVTRYVWRGFDYGIAPAFQPTLAYSTTYKKVGVEVGAWGSYAVTGSFAEIDLYGTFNFPFGWVGVIDYYYPTEVTSTERFYDFGRNSTHTIEALVGFEGPKKVPIRAMFGYNVYAPTTDPHGSWYVELSYPLSLPKKVEMNFVVGAGHGSYYTQKGDFMPINIGISASRSFSIAKDKIAIPVSISLVTNPDTQKVFFVAAVGIYKK